MSLRTARRSEAVPVPLHLRNLRIRLAPGACALRLCVGSCSRPRAKVRVAVPRPDGPNPPAARICRQKGYEPTVPLTVPRADDGEPVAIRGRALPAVRGFLLGHLGADNHSLDPSANGPEGQANPPEPLGRFNPLSDSRRLLNTWGGSLTG